MDLLTPLSAPLPMLSFGRKALRCVHHLVCRSQLNDLLPRDASRGLRAIERGPAWSQQCATERQGVLTDSSHRFARVYLAINANHRDGTCYPRCGKTRKNAIVLMRGEKQKQRCKTASRLRLRSQSVRSSFLATFPFPTFRLRVYDSK